MEQSLADVFSDLLSEYEKHPEMSVEEIIRQKLEGVGMQDSAAQVQEATDFIANLDANMESLQNARANGTTRKTWFINSMDEVLDGQEEGKKIELLEALDKTMKKVEQNAISTEN